MISDYQMRAIDIGARTTVFKFKFLEVHWLCCHCLDSYNSPAVLLCVCMFRIQLSPLACFTHSVAAGGGTAVTVDVWRTYLSMSHHLATTPPMIAKVCASVALYMIPRPFDTFFSLDRSKHNSYITSSVHAQLCLACWNEYNYFLRYIVFTAYIFNDFKA